MCLTHKHALISTHSTWKGTVGFLKCARCPTFQCAHYMPIAVGGDFAKFFNLLESLFHISKFFSTPLSD